MSAYNSFFHSLNKIRLDFPHCKLIIREDFNLPSLSCVVKNNYVIYTGYMDTKASVVLDGFSFLNCRQFNIHYNRPGSLLDLVFSDLPYVWVSNNDDEVLVLLNISYHPTELVEFTIPIMVKIQFKLFLF